LTIGFLGQCHVRGYEGVPADEAFPEVCRRVIQASRPAQQVELVAETYHHPADLQRVTTAILRQRPRIVVIEVVGWLAIAGSRVVDLSRLPGPVRSAVERRRHLRNVSRHVSEQTSDAGAIHVVKTGALALASGLLQPLLPRFPRPTVEGYEACVAAALQQIQADPSVTAVIQGPGAGNFAAGSKRLPADAVARYHDVHAMARRVAAQHHALFVDRWDTVGSGFFIKGTTRPTLQGHSAWGHLLADELLRAGLV
jgi:hypothetical protein